MRTWCTQEQLTILGIWFESLKSFSVPSSIAFKTHDSVTFSNGPVSLLVLAEDAEYAAKARELSWLHQERMNPEVWPVP
jgi:hypothetical protein